MMQDDSIRVKLDFDYKAVDTWLSYTYTEHDWLNMYKLNYHKAQCLLC